jgi:hypothetical protein
MDRRVKWFAAAAVAALAVGPASAGTGHQWGDYHWLMESGSTKVSLTLHHKFRDPRWLVDGYHTRSIGLWHDNSESPLNLTDGGESASSSSKKCDPLAGKILVCSDNYGFRGWLGIASIWADGNHITQSTVKYNDSYYSSGTYNTPAQREFVTCHEVGHTFGLGHLDEDFNNQNKGSCMDYTSDPDGDANTGNPDNRFPGQVDWNVLNSSTAYGHDHAGGGDGGGDDGGGDCNPRSPKCAGLDAFTFREVGQTPRASSGAEEEWGRIIGYDRHGRPNEYLLDLGNGRRKITHVMWIPGHRPPGSR